MKLSFFGAVGEVTGSNFLLETSSQDSGPKKYLIDCGMIQGSSDNELRNYHRFAYDPASIEAVLVTHAHADHIGRIPKLYKDGFHGLVYSTGPTKDLAEIVGRDSAGLIAESARELGREPFFSESDVEAVVKNNWRTVGYRQPFDLGDLSVTFHDAGHILGSAFIELSQTSEMGKTKIVFSGDLGNPPVPFLEPTETLTGANYVVIESTYGDREHEPTQDRHDKLKSVIVETIKKGGVLMIPTFAIERAQEVLYELDHLVDEGEVPAVPIFLDSPLAIKATRIFRKYPQFWNDQALRQWQLDDFFHFRGLNMTVSTQESKAINTLAGPKIIIAGSGMIHGGRIMHHLRRYLSDPKSTLLIIGYQAHGTLGRALFEGARHVKIFGARVEVRASVKAIGAYSAHADQPKLIRWLSAMKHPKPSQVFLAHGEPDKANALARAISSQLSLKARVPVMGESVSL